MAGWLGWLVGWLFVCLFGTGAWAGNGLKSLGFGAQAGPEGWRSGGVGYVF